MMHNLLMIFLFCLLHISLTQAQSIAVKGSEAELDYQKEYEKNITLTKINGVYIPGSLKEAFRRLDKLTTPEAITKFMAAPEKEVCKKLHFGIGRWMIENWHFYGGSRISHHLKSKGVLHPDDMAQFLLRTYHRYLNKQELNEEALVDELALNRKKIAAEVRGY